MSWEAGEEPALAVEIPLGASRKPNRTPWLIAILLIAALAAAGYAGISVGGTPSIELVADKGAIGKETVFSAVVREPRRGLVTVVAVLRQGGAETVLDEQRFAPQALWAPWSRKTEEVRLELKVGKNHQSNLEEGPATVEIRATGASTWVLPPPELIEAQTLPVRLRPPPIAVTAQRIYVRQGGAEAVTYTVGPTSVKDGVMVGRWFFPGYPHPNGDDQERVALFAIPFDMDNVDGVRLIAEDEVGNRSATPFIEDFKAKPFARDTITVSDRFMKKVVPRIRARTPDLPDQGSLLANYVQINRDLRKVNNARLEGLAVQTQPQVLWKKPFVQMPRAKVVSRFADRRTYLYKGKKIDQQDHLGFDLASIARDEIPAANDGIVVMAEYLGIYGNTVVIDHGLGLMSLYAHCSTVEVEVGDRVERGQRIGRTGATGLALGDHLHFTMLVGGVPVNPLEWWDGHWIRDRLARKLPGVFSVKGQ